MFSCTTWVITQCVKLLVTWYRYLVYVDLWILPGWWWPLVLGLRDAYGMAGWVNFPGLSYSTGQFRKWNWHAGNVQRLFLFPGEVAGFCWRLAISGYETNIMDGMEFGIHSLLNSWLNLLSPTIDQIIELIIYSQQRYRNLKLQKMYCWVQDSNFYEYPVQRLVARGGSRNFGKGGEIPNKYQISVFMASRAKMQGLILS